VADAAIKHFDHIDLLVNNAGIYINKPFTDYMPADFELMIGTNVAGYFFITQKVAAQMSKQKSGHIVGISTVLTDQPLAGAAISLPVLTKSTIPVFNRALAMGTSRRPRSAESAAQVDGADGNDGAIC
jgi:NADP-dependent 3-hydroxy acid dehydrogenase YdfG